MLVHCNNQPSHKILTLGKRVPQGHVGARLNYSYNSYHNMDNVAYVCTGRPVVHNWLMQHITSVVSLGIGMHACLCIVPMLVYVVSHECLPFVEIYSTYLQLCEIQTSAHCPQINQYIKLIRICKCFQHIPSMPKVINHVVEYLGVWYRTSDLKGPQGWSNLIWCKAPVHFLCTACYICFLLGMTHWPASQISWLSLSVATTVSL